MSTRIQVRRGTAAEGTAQNPILAAGEWGYETNTGKAKVGDGSTAWADLPYSLIPADQIAGKALVTSGDGDFAWADIGTQTEIDLKVDKSTLTANGNILTRAAGVPAEITRADLAADAAFTGAFEPRRADIYLHSSDFGVLGDVKYITSGCSATAGTPNITVPTGTILPADAGKLLYIGGAGAAGAGASPDQAGVFGATILSADGVGNVVVDANAVTSVSNSFVEYGHDDTAAYNAWATALSAYLLGFGRFTTVAGIADPGHSFITGEIGFGSASARSDGMTIDWGGPGVVRLIWAGANCDDGSTPGTYPKVDESVLHFKNCYGLKQIGTARIEALLGGVMYNRVGIWYDASVNAGSADFGDVEVNGMVTSVLLGGALTYTGGTWLAPTGWVSGPAGQYNSCRFGRLRSNGVIETLRLHGVNGETVLIEMFTPSGVCHIRSYNGRGPKILHGDGVHAGTSMPFPGQSPNDFIIVDAQGSSLNGGGPVANICMRQEQLARIAKCTAAGGGFVGGTLDLIVDGLQGSGVMSADRTVATGAMTAGSDVLSLAGISPSLITANDVGRLVTVPGAGPAGAALSGYIRQVISTTTCHLNVQASTTVSGQTVTVTGLAAPLKAVQWGGQGHIDLKNSVLPAPGSYVSIENITSARRATVAIEGCSINATAGADSDPTKLVAVVQSGGGTTGGVEASIERSLTCDTGALPTGRLSNRIFKITPADAAAATFQNMLFMDGTNRQLLTDYQIVMGGVSLTNPTYPARQMHSGRWYVFPSAPPTTGGLVDQLLQWVPMDVQVAQSIDRIGCEVVTTPGSTGSVVRLGIHNDDGTNNPAGTLLLDAGTVDSTTTGVKSIVVSKALVTGRFWLSSTGQGAPATAPVLRQAQAGNDSTVGLFAQSGAYQRGYRQAGVSGSLPSPGVPATDTTQAPYVSVRAV